MTPHVSRVRAAAVALLLAAAACAPAAQAAPASTPTRAPAGAPAPAPAPADTSVDVYIRALADTTERWFGASAQAPDTTGLDSTRAWALAHPKAEPNRAHRLRLAPEFDFNRVLGPAEGARLMLGATSSGPGEATAWAQHAAGPRAWYGGGDLQRRWIDVERGSAWGVRARAGRYCETLDRDFGDSGLDLMRALFAGADRQHRLRRDGAKLVVRRQAPAWWLAGVARIERETPLATTATWYLGGHGLLVTRNDSALAGRVHEASLTAGAHLPRTPLTVEAQVWNAGGALGGDLDYTRVRATLGGPVRLGAHFVLAPEMFYGRLNGSAPPQDAFYGGGAALRSQAAHTAPSAGAAAAHADLLLEDPLQRLAGRKGDPQFPIQFACFAGASARWGFDPVTGLARPTARNWPQRGAWNSEAGVSLLYRPGVPVPDAYLRIDWAFPLGGDGRGRGTYLSFTRLLEFRAP